MPRKHYAAELPPQAVAEAIMRAEIAALYAVIVGEINVLRASLKLPLRTEEEAQHLLHTMQQRFRTTRTTEDGQ